MKSSPRWPGGNSSEVTSAQRKQFHPLGHLQPERGVNEVEVVLHVLPQIVSDWVRAGVESVGD